jgi:segregation and condensation protein A
MAEAEPALAPVGADAASPAPGDGSPVVIDQVALARLYGEPLFALPQDLYIPPDALEVFLEAFEGPLDLELAAEYLLMAAMLIEIKSRMLLPPKKQEGGEEAEDPRAELVRRLLEYEQIKLAAHQLGQVPHYGRDFLRAQIHIEQSLQPRFPDVDVAELQSAWRDILKRAKLVQSHKITREELSVREYMSQVLKALQGRRFVEFETLFQPEKGSTVLVVTFIAMLELAKETLIEITQAEAFAPIYVRLAYTPV